MEKKNDSNLGDQIKSIVQDALNTTDYRRLNEDISNTVYRALDEVKWNLKKGQDKLDQKLGDQFGQVHMSKPKRERDRGADYGNLKENRRERNPKMDRRQIAYEKKSNYLPDVISKKPVGRVSGVLCITFGYIGIGISGILLFILSLISIFGGEPGMLAPTLATLIPILSVSTVLAWRGTWLRKRVGRFRRYIKRMDGKTFCSIKDLAHAIGRSDSYVIKDLRKMIQLGMFPQATVPEDRSCFLLDRSTYENYTKMVAGKKLQAEEEKRIAQENQKQREIEENDPAMKDVHAIIEEGRVIIQTIRKANDAIPGEEISRKLDRLEIVITKIFAHIAKHPEDLAEIHKFLDYYLPTTLKLVNAYQEMDAQPIQGENILTAKNEIEGTLDTINSAFEKLLDSFFEDTAMDISTDISVLQTMLAQEGLAPKDFK